MPRQGQAFDPKLKVARPGRRPPRFIRPPVYAHTPGDYKHITDNKPVSRGVIKAVLATGAGPGDIYRGIPINTLIIVDPGVTRPGGRARAIRSNWQQKRAANSAAIPNAKAKSRFRP